jgi:uncharacterized membrane protein
MPEQKRGGFPVATAIVDILSIPYNLLAGFVVGAVVPVMAIAAIVGGIRLLTGQVPFLGMAGEEESGQRNMSLTLVAPDAAEEMFAEQKEQIGGELANLRTEIQAIIEEARAEAVEEAEEA